MFSSLPNLPRLKWKERNGNGFHLKEQEIVNRCHGEQEIAIHFSEDAADRRGYRDWQSRQVSACKLEPFMRSDTLLLTGLLRGSVLTGKLGVKHTLKRVRPVSGSAPGALGRALSTAHLTPAAR